MKAWISICTIISVAGMVTVLAQETKTNTPAGAVTNTPITNEVAAQPPAATPAPAPAPAVVKEVKPPVVAPLIQTSTVPVQPRIPAAPLTPTKAVAPLPMTATSAPAPATTNEVRPADFVPLEETSAVPAQTNITAEPLTPTNAATPPPESSGIGRKGVWAGGVAFLVLAGGLAIFIWRRSHTTSQESLITSAMNENQKSREDKNAPPPMA
jgi:hypothetical protein